MANPTPLILLGAIEREMWLIKTKCYATRIVWYTCICHAWTLYVCILLITSLFMGRYIYIFSIYQASCCCSSYTSVEGKISKEPCPLEIKRDNREREREMWSKSDIGKLLRCRFKLQSIHQKTRLGLYHYHCTRTVRSKGYQYLFAIYNNLGSTQLNMLRFLPYSRPGFYPCHPLLLSQQSCQQDPYIPQFLSDLPSFIIIFFLDLYFCSSKVSLVL